MKFLAIASVSILGLLINIELPYLEPPEPPGFYVGTNKPANYKEPELPKEKPKKPRAEHFPPVVTIDMRVPPQGPNGELIYFECQPGFNTQVPVKAIWEKENNKIRIEFEGVAGKTYEVQEKLYGANWVWMCSGRFSLTKTDHVTTWCTIQSTIECALIRVMMK